MKRLALFILLAALPAVAFGSQHYIVVTTHPFDEAVQRLPRQDFDPAVRAAMRVRLAVPDLLWECFTRLPVHIPSWQPQFFHVHGIEDAGKFPALGGDFVTASRRRQRRGR